MRPSGVCSPIGPNDQSLEVNVAFLNENALGHASYLLPFADWLRRHPEAGIQPEVIHATPLPECLKFRADCSVRGLRQWGLDFHNARWRLTVSRHAREQLDALSARQRVDAIVVNTQSAGLRLADLPQELPVFVCLDATFEQLARSRWFAPNAPSRWFHPLTLRALRQRERTLFARARRLLPWSEPARQSLLNEYGIAAERIALLPPSLNLAAFKMPGKPAGTHPQILFVGGDFQRKGGPLLLDCFQKHFAGRCELHLVTESSIAAPPGAFVHHGIKAHSDAWRERWRQADVFVFPSSLETFGIVLLEALAFQVPVVSADVGAAREILGGGDAGWLLERVDERTLATAIHSALEDPDTALAKTAAGRRRVEQDYNLDTNAQQLAEWLRNARGS